MLFLGGKPPPAFLEVLQESAPNKINAVLGLVPQHLVYPRFLFFGGEAPPAFLEVFQESAPN